MSSQDVCSLALALLHSDIQVQSWDVCILHCKKLLFLDHLKKKLIFVNFYKNNNFLVRNTNALTLNLNISESNRARAKLQTFWDDKHT